jgi:hypothetical protein
MWQVLDFSVESRQPRAALHKFWRTIGAGQSVASKIALRAITGRGRSGAFLPLAKQETRNVPNSCARSALHP